MNRKSRGLERLLKSIEAESRAAGMVKALQSITEYVKDGMKWGDFSVEGLNRHLFAEITQGEKELDGAGKGVLAARVTCVIEEVAAEHGAIDPGLVAGYIEQENTVRAGVVEKDGTATGITVESKDMMRGEGLEEHIRRLRIAPDTACLFRTGQPSQGNMKPITNPWKKETFNLTMQGKIITENPEMAERLKAEANIAG